MRIELIFVPLVLVACGAPQAPATGDGAATVRSAGQLAAEQACADMTGHASRPDAASEVDTKREQLYLSCLASVTKGDSAAPPLRGRTYP